MQSQQEHALGNVTEKSSVTSLVTFIASFFSALYSPVSPIEPIAAPDVGSSEGRRALQKDLQEIRTLFVIPPIAASPQRHRRWSSN